MELARYGIVLVGASYVVSLAIGILLGLWIGASRQPAERDLKKGTAPVEQNQSIQKQRDNSTIQYLEEYANATIDKLNEIIRLLNRLKLEDLAEAVEIKHSGYAPGASGPENSESSGKETAPDTPPARKEHTEPSFVLGELKINPESFANPSDVGARALALLDEGGRTSAIASVAGLKEWIRTNCGGFIAEPLLQSEGSWLIAVVSRMHENCGSVFPALDTVIGAGMILEWFECRGYDGTRVLQRKHVIDLAEAIRDQRGERWRVKKKGLISREAAGGGA
jgi:hypothetical protein